ncbi:MAG TPA: serine/threonine-protein kinase [Thermoanaerobaculia bacterium]|nr:serine/threonine-protein kinase [Thermoanaerobaculia bacterium]
MAEASACPRCGRDLTSASQVPTGLATPSVAAAAGRVPSSPIGRLAFSDSIDPGGFTPGTVLSERYRIIGLIGRGGMGEVYRADDLKLGQPVALKFLPDRLSSDQKLLDRFFSEVRTSRSVAHPNVCRVYDIGEVDGRHFISMEYVDGEDLASLLRRIGRLPPDKALELSRQICAGLSAAHDRGVLHRDLKPANVMVDGRGRARIMDFGLAVAASESGTEAEIGGTPAYMAPEQFAGKGASVRSDLYALGLVLYELHTGKRAFDAGSIEDYRRKHAEDPPTSPSAMVAGIEPAVERAILRCLEKDPARRPTSAAQVAAALPGGDPLAAAIAAGETPSPEMVAAAGSEEAISPRLARSLLATVVLGSIALLALVGRTHLLAAVDSQRSPDVLRARAREILVSIGMPDRPEDWAADVAEDRPFVDWVTEHDRSPDRWSRGISRDALDYVYRESPTLLIPADTIANPYPGPRITAYDPAPSMQSGDATMVLDGDGRLKLLSIQTPELEKPAGPPRAPDWGALFRAAGLDMGRFTPVEPAWTPSLFADARAAWQGPHPERPGMTMRVEAAAYRGRPVAFRWIGPWTQPDRDIFDVRSPGTRTAELVWALICLTLFFGGAWLVRRNLRAGRGDRRGAMRLAMAVTLCELGAWAFGAHHTSGSQEFEIIFPNGLSNALLFGVFIWIIYMAVEPFARRNWPQMLISWARLLGGRLRDPLVGRDLLVGAAAAVLIELVRVPAVRSIAAAFGFPAAAPRAPDFVASARETLAYAISLPVATLVWTLGIVFFLALALRWVRSEWLAAVIVITLFSLTFVGTPVPFLVGSAFYIAAIVFVAIRFGLLAALIADLLFNGLYEFVRTADPSAWYFYTTPIAIAVVLGLAIWGYRTAVPVRAVALATA